MLKLILVKLLKSSPVIDRESVSTVSKQNSRQKLVFLNLPVSKLKMLHPISKFKNEFSYFEEAKLAK